MLWEEGTACELSVPGTGFCTIGDRRVEVLDGGIVLVGVVFENASSAGAIAVCPALGRRPGLGLLLHRRLS